MRPNLRQYESYCVLQYSTMRLTAHYGSYWTQLCFNVLLSSVRVPLCALLCSTVFLSLRLIVIHYLQFSSCNAIRCSILLLMMIYCVTLCVLIYASMNLIGSYNIPQCVLLGSIVFQCLTERLLCSTMCLAALYDVPLYVLW
ncbi:hypothetical protein CEXT_249661 [Caerostris extrusa]|uniref:Uncharacterized protein n=1 Tax=Caerostris extrusa TaxID=172846 RepID=A0AAV4UHM2_CAEEX|nr:hypothetical protein CEXT_249661 [Caerostris extrusa]